MRFLIEVFALESLYWQACNEQDTALATVERAIKLAKPGGYVRIFADLGEEIDNLLARLQQQGVEPLLIAAIREAIEPRRDAMPPGIPPARDNLEVLLTFREQEVLKLIGEHMTNQEIAAALSISPETVKRHSMSIFRKLNVKNRRAAALYARELSLS